MWFAITMTRSLRAGSGENGEAKDNENMGRCLTITSSSIGVKSDVENILTPLTRQHPRTVTRLITVKFEREMAREDNASD